MKRALNSATLFAAILVSFHCSDCGAPTAGSVSETPPSGLAVYRLPERSLPESVKLYWAKPIENYSMSPPDAQFSYSKSYPQLVSIFDAALSEANKKAVGHLRPLDAMAELYIHCFENYDGAPPGPLVWWVQYKLGIPHWAVMFDGHVEMRAEGEGAPAKLDEELKKAAAAFDAQGGLWSYGVARAETEPGKYSQFLVFAEKRLLLEDFPKKVAAGGELQLRGTVVGAARHFVDEFTLAAKMATGADLPPTFTANDDGTFRFRIELSKQSGEHLVSLSTMETKNGNPKGVLFLPVYVDAPEPALPEDVLFYWPDVSPQHECARYAPPPPQPKVGALPSEPSYAQKLEALKPLKTKLKSCGQVEGGEMAVDIVIDGSGRVRSAGAFGENSESKTGRCVATALCEAVFPPFSAPELVFFTEIEL